MPVERQAERVSTPLTRRDKRVLAVLAVVAAGGIGGGVFAYADRGGKSSSEPCVTVTLPNTMGGATIRRCGSEAAAFCRKSASSDRLIAEACRRRGF